MEYSAILASYNTGSATARQGTEFAVNVEISAWCHDISVSIASHGRDFLRQRHPRLVASFIFYQNYASEWQAETAPMLRLKHNTNLLVE
jgi:hypothetical protein